MTHEGTNTYLYRPARFGGGSAGKEPGTCVVIDPGVEDAEHLAAIEAAAAELSGGAGIEAVLISHEHPDHTGGAEAFGAPVIHPADGEVWGGLRAIATPGHADDHLCFLTEDDASDRVLFSADLILGEGSTFVQPGGGSLIAYMNSLERVRELSPSLICPGHGPWVTDPASKVEEYIEHRMMRERNLVAALGRGLRGQDTLIDEVWSDAPAELRPFTALVLRAHLEKLEIESRLPESLMVDEVLGPKA